MRLVNVIGMLAMTLTLSARQSGPDYQSGLLILKDGRQIAIRGDYEVRGQEVQFISGDGDLMTLPLEKVDLKVTEQRNFQIRQKAADAKIRAKDGNTLYHQIEDYKRETANRSADKRPEIHIDGDQLKSQESATNDPPAKTSGPKHDASNPQLEEMEARIKVIQERMNRFTEEVAMAHPWFLLIGSLLLGLLAIIALFLHLYLLVRGFGVGFGWGIMLVLTASIPIVISFSSLFSQNQALVFGLAVASQIISLTHTILLLVFIWKYCYGKRFLFYFLLFAPMILVVIFIVMLMKWGILLPADFF